MNYEDLKYKLSSKWSSFTYIFRKPYYKLRLLYRLSKITYFGPWEMVNVLMGYMFTLFCEFYEQCDIKNSYRPKLEEANEYDYNLTQFTIKKLDDFEKLYYWWTVEYKEKQEALDYLLSVWSEHFVSWFERCEEEGYYLWQSASSRYCEYLHELLFIEEEKFEKEKEDMLHLLVSYRNSLWE